MMLDLSWCAHGAFSDRLREAHPILDTVYGQDDGLRDRVQNFWPDGVNYFAEAEVLAYLADALEVTDFSDLRARLDTALATVPLDLALESETPDDRRRILDRLAQLQRSPRIRHQYFDLLEDLWVPLAEWWVTDGRSSVSSALSDVRRSLERGAKWFEGETLSEQLPSIIERNENGQPLILAACALFGRGLYLELPGCTLIGFGTHASVQGARVRTEHVVAPLRALADPTRLAIFEYLRSGGLVSADRQGNRTELSINSSAADALAKDLNGLLTRESAS